MEGTEHQILKICEEGIISNCILEGDSISSEFLNNIKEFESEKGVENWIILREMGAFVIGTLKSEMQKMFQPLSMKIFSSILKFQQYLVK